MPNPSIVSIKKQDVLRAVERAFQGRPGPDDANLLKAVAAWIDGLYQYGERAACLNATERSSS